MLSDMIFWCFFSRYGDRTYGSNYLKNSKFSDKSIKWIEIKSEFKPIIQMTISISHSLFHENNLSQLYLQFFCYHGRMKGTKKHVVKY